MFVTQLISQQKLNRILIVLMWLAMALLILYTIYVGANTVWSIVAGQAQSTSDSQPVRVAASQQNTVNMKEILAANLFGKADESELDLSDADKLRETTLNLELIGTIVDAESPNFRRALIANLDGSGSSRQYRAGDAISGFAKIESIQPRLVVIARSGERERLTFVQHNHIQSKEVHQEPAAEQSAIEVEVPNLPELDVESAQWGFEDLKELGLIERERSGGSVLVVEQTDGTSILGRLGMQPGDVVLKVNDVSLSDVQSDRQLAQDILSSGIARLEITRDDREFVITVPLP